MFPFTSSPCSGVALHGRLQCHCRPCGLRVSFDETGENGIRFEDPAELMWFNMLVARHEECVTLIHLFIEGWKAFGQRIEVWSSLNRLVLDVPAISCGRLALWTIWEPFRVSTRWRRQWQPIWYLLGLKEKLFPFALHRSVFVSHDSW